MFARDKVETSDVKAPMARSVWERLLKLSLLPVSLWAGAAAWDAEVTDFIRLDVRFGGCT